MCYTDLGHVRNDYKYLYQLWSVLRKACKLVPGWRQHQNKCQPRAIWAVISSQLGTESTSRIFDGITEASLQRVWRSGQGRGVQLAICESLSAARSRRRYILCDVNQSDHPARGRGISDEIRTQHLCRFGHVKLK